jgi:1,4-dihydroxy-2-naphthoate octaprenyltransferase
VTTAGQWVAGARPKTLPLAVGPVLVGTAAASTVGPTIWWRFAAALVVSLALQVGVNYANDYSDGLRGTDRDRRGPLRLTASGTASARSVRLAAGIALATAAAVGTALAVTVDLRLLLLGVLCVAGAWLYSGGRHPYGYHGLGEVAVLFFFGFVATLGSAYVQHRMLPSAAWWGSLVVGLPACAVLVVNNLRDIDTDRVAGKRTLAVRIGGRRTRAAYVGLLLVAFLALVPVAVEHPTASVAFAAAPMAVAPLRRVVAGDDDPAALVRVLVLTVRLAVALAVLLAVGLALA